MAVGAGAAVGAGVCVGDTGGVDVGAGVAGAVEHADATSARTSKDAVSLERSARERGKETPFKATA